MLREVSTGQLQFQQLVPQDLQISKFPHHLGSTSSQTLTDPVGTVDEVPGEAASVKDKKGWEVAGLRLVGPRFIITQVSNVCGKHTVVPVFFQSCGVLFLS